MPAAIAIRKRAAVPELPQLRLSFGVWNPRDPTPLMTHLDSSCSITTPIALRQFAIDRMSFPTLPVKLSPVSPSACAARANQRIM